MSRDVLMAAIVGAHGLKGDVRVKYFARTPQSLGAYVPLHDASVRVFTQVRQHPAAPDELVVAFAEVRDRTAAEALKGVKLFVAREALPATSGEEYYHTDLIGLDAVDGDGAQIGKVTAVHNFGAGDILEIVGTDGRDILLAFTKDNVPTIDLETGRLTVIEPRSTEAGAA